jgi:hypothetical protein
MLDDSKYSDIDMKVAKVMNNIEAEMTKLYGQEYQKSYKNAYSIALYHLALTHIFIIDEGYLPDFLEKTNSMSIDAQIWNEKNLE